MRQWEGWIREDLEGFLRPLAERTGLSLQEVLLYLMQERLGQIVEQGIVLRVFARHDIHQEPPEEGEEWKK